MADTDLYRLVYSSKLVKGQEIDLNGLCSHAAEKNRKRFISGALLFNLDTLDFLQILEGPKLEIDLLWLVMKDDMRHYNVKIHYNAPLTKRGYNEWGMLVGSEKDWKLMRMLLASSESKLISTFDDLFRKKIPTTHGTKGLSNLDSSNGQGGPLCRILFSSYLVKADDSKSQLDSDYIELVASICNKSAPGNKCVGMSGVLVFNDRKLQLIKVLEGPEDHVDNLWEAIRQDPRHTDIVLLEMKRDISQRSCSEWGLLVGQQKDWNRLKTSLPPCIPEKIIASFDKAYYISGTSDKKEDRTGPSYAITLQVEQKTKKANDASSSRKVVSSACIVL